MAPFRRQGSLSRSAALIALGALSVHQLRYLLAYGGAAHAELARQGHGYLTQVLPLLIGAAAAILAARLVRAALGSRQGATPAAAGVPVRIALFAAAIASAFAIQESVEGLVFAGHASGFAAVVARGGWLALPLSLLFGTLAALLDGGFVRLEALVGRPGREAARRRAPRRSGRAVAAAALCLTLSPLAFGLARRPPPRAA
jgi:hypothetical protein